MSTLMLLSPPNTPRFSPKPIIPHSKATCRRCSGELNCPNLLPNSTKMVGTRGMALWVSKISSLSSSNGSIVLFDLLREVESGGVSSRVSAMSSLSLLNGQNVFPYFLEEVQTRWIPSWVSVVPWISLLLGSAIALVERTKGPTVLPNSPQEVQTRPIPSWVSVVPWLSYLLRSPCTVVAWPNGPNMLSNLPQEAETRQIPLRVLVISSLCLTWVLLGCGSAIAATAAKDSIGASKVGLRIATALRGTGWADEVIVFALATLPVLELRGAIPVGYWMQLDPLLLTALAIVGNMVPVPFILLYLKRLASFLSQRSTSATKLFDLLFERAREKAGPVREFQWLGLMLFVAVPFPGTGAWSGAIVASVLDMPLWAAVSANFFGVVIAGLLVNLLVNLGLKYAIATGLVLFLVSTVMFTMLRRFKKSSGSNQ